MHNKYYEMRQSNKRKKDLPRYISLTRLIGVVLIAISTIMYSKKIPDLKDELNEIYLSIDNLNYNVDESQATELLALIQHGFAKTMVALESTDVVIFNEFREGGDISLKSAFEISFEINNGRKPADWEIPRDEDGNLHLSKCSDKIREYIKHSPKRKEYYTQRDSLKEKIGKWSMFALIFQVVGLALQFEFRRNL